MIRKISQHVSEILITQNKKTNYVTIFNSFHNTKFSFLLTNKSSNYIPMIKKLEYSICSSKIFE